MRRLTLLLITLPLLVHAQLIDHFSDGNFTQNPTWTANVEKFIVNPAQQLQLNDTASGTAYLLTENHAKAPLEWNCWVKAAFSPSSNNFIRIYLMSDHSDLSKALNGYFLQLGEAGNKDALELFRQDGDKMHTVCRGSDSLIATSFSIRIRIRLDSNGKWGLSADPDGGYAFQQEASGFDTTYQTTSYFGFYCKYTASNRSKIYFDDVYAGPFIQDNEPPLLLDVTPASDSSLLLTFNESLLDSVARQAQHYRLVSSGSHPKSITLSEHGSQVLIVFPATFLNGLTDTLEVSGLQDVAGNRMENQKKAFTYYHPQAFDIVINEIMADPNPPVGLPEFEYIELWNQSGVNISLKGWKLQIGKAMKVFGETILPAGQYMILSKPEAEEAFSTDGLFYGFSSMNLTNSGQQLVLMAPSGEVISQVSYTDSWYHNADKTSGGWSLEQINPANVCSGSENWKASENTNGGTPGQINSVYEDILLNPSIEHFQLSSNHEINLQFSQQMDETTISNALNYEITPENITPDTVYIYGQWPSVVRLGFSSSFDSSRLYQLQISAALSNCRGIHLRADTSVSFGLPGKAEAKDIVINEVLFNPLAAGVDYVELYNRSEKIIDLSSLQLGTVKISPPAANDTLFYAVSPQQQLYLPHSFLLLTSSPDMVKKQYFTENPRSFLKMTAFPNYGDKEGCVILKQTGMIIDQFHYSENMQYPLLTYLDGVALERISFDGETNDRNNWHSASETVGFGTPAYQNSQFVSDSSIGKEIQIQPEIFSPDNDGYQDVLPIKYTFSKAGYTMTITIFNSSGQLVRHLVNNEYIGTSGLFSWDGLRDDNTRAPAGIYILYVQLFDMSGHVKNYKKTAVLAYKLK